jgi:hypothetical protein
MENDGSSSATWMEIISARLQAQVTRAWDLGIWDQPWLKRTPAICSSYLQVKAPSGKLELLQEV